MITASTSPTMSSGSISPRLPASKPAMWLIAMVIRGMLSNPALPPNPDLVSPMRKTANATSSHQGLKGTVSFNHR